MLEINYSGTLNKNGDIITVLDVTGSDNLPLSTKYAVGGLNPNKEISDNKITEFIVTKPDGGQVTKRYNVLINSVTPNIAATSQVPIPANTLTLYLEPSDLEYGDTLYPDGMMKFDTTIWMQVVGTSSATIGSDLKTISYASGQFTSSKYGFGDTVFIKVIKLSASSNEINSVISEITSDTSLVLESALSSPFTNGDTLYILAGYKVTFWVKMVSNLMKCYMPKIAKISVADRECCDKCGMNKIDKLDDIMLRLFDVEAQIDTGMYVEAQKNILALGKLCEQIGCRVC